MQGKTTRIEESKACLYFFYLYTGIFLITQTSLQSIIRCMQVWFIKKLIININSAICPVKISEVYGLLL